MSKVKEQTRFQYCRELGGLEVVNANYHHKNFSRHTHESYTIAVINHGIQRFFRSGQDHYAPQGSIIFVNADDVHNGQSATENGWSYQAIYPLERQFKALAKDLGLADNFAPYFPNAVVDDPQMASELQQLFNVLCTSENALHRETLLNGVMTRLMIKHGISKPSFKDIRTNKQPLELVQQYIHDNLFNNISLTTLASLSGLSSYYLVRQFQKLYGLPPHAYQIQARLHKSKALLKQGISVSAVAVELGFHDQSHFHRHFVKANGVSPGNYAHHVYPSHLNMQFQS